MRAYVAIASLCCSLAHAGAPLYIPPVPAKEEPTPKEEAPPDPPPPPPASPGRARVLVLDMKANDVEPTTVQTVTNIVVAGLSAYKTLDVISGDDVKQLVELEATRTQMGCSEDASCLAEIAGALGAQLVVFGAVGRLGDATVVTLNLFDSQKAQALGRVSTQSKHADRLPKRIARRIHELVAGYHEQHNLVMPPPPPPEDTGPGALPWLTVASGVVVAAGGAAAAIVGVLPLLDYNAASARVVAAERAFAAGDAAALDDAKAAQADLQTARKAYNGYGFLALDSGIALVGVGLAVTGAGVAWAVASAQDDDPDLGETAGGAQ